MDMDEKIVSYLRQRLINKTRQRLQMARKQKNSEFKEQGNMEKEQSRGEKAKPTLTNLLNHYSETGEKIQAGNLTNSTQTTKQLLLSTQHGTPPGNFTTNSGSTLPVFDNTIMPNSSAKGIVSSTTTQLPAVTPRTTSTNGKRHGKESEDLSIMSAKVIGDTKKIFRPGETSEEFHLPPLNSKMKSQQDRLALAGMQRTFSNNINPRTTDGKEHERERVTSQNSVHELLDGKLCIDFPTNNVHYLYVASTSTDMEGELTFMQEHLYLKLRDHFRLRGLELRILDFHWACRDWVSDDHQVADILRRAIKKAHDRASEINFLILLGQKYGPYILPLQIPKEEFEKILMAAKQYRKSEKRRLWAAMENRETEQNKLGDDTELETKATNIQKIDHVDGIDEFESTTKPPSTDTNHPNNNIDEVPFTTDIKDLSGASFKTSQQMNKILRDAEDQLPDIKSLKQWYLLDENAVPPVYKLQNISIMYKDILGNDAAKRQVAKLSYVAVESKLLKILQSFASVVDTSEDYHKLYKTSEFDIELRSILDQQSASEHTACVVRTIDYLTEHLDEPSIGDYIDLLPCNQPALDVEKWTSIDKIRQAILNDKVSDKNVSTQVVEWTAGGIRPGSNRDHALYMERACKILFEQILGNVRVERIKSKSNSWKFELFQEVSEHLRKCQESIHEFQGREDILDQIKSYLSSDYRHPLVVHGKNGCGKSAILGKAATEVHRWKQSNEINPYVLVRMIGCTTGSVNTRTLLREIVLQLCCFFEQHPAEIPKDYKGLVNDLCCRLGHATREHPLVFILDGVDRLSDDYEGRKLTWLPAVLPPYVNLIISTSSDQTIPCLQAARKLLGDNDTSFVEIPELREHETVAMLRHMLSSRKRQLTDLQFQECLQALKKCPNPLYLQVAVTEVSGWTSYMPPASSKLGDTVKGIVTIRFGRLEKDHGEPLTRRALGYLSASRHGLTSNEMEDILSLDDAVMNDIQTRYKPPKRRLPSLVWIRFLGDIEDLITECKTDEVKTLKWAHDLFHEAAVDRYLNQRDKAPSYHKALAEYFSWAWSGKVKSRSSNDKGVDALVSRQELFMEPERCSLDGSDRVYNQRGLNELPFYLMRCHMIKQLKQWCLFNYEWMLARLCGTSLESMIEEYQTVVLAEPKDQEIRVLFDTLHLSSHALQQEPRQLASQLVGRLHRIVTADNPRSPGDPKMYPNLHTLFAASRQPSIPALIPSVACLTEPGGIMCDVLSGHTSAVTALSLTSDGTLAVSASEDNTIKLWDMRSCKVIKSISGVGKKVSFIRTVKTDTLVITVEGLEIRMWDLDLGCCVFNIDHYEDPASISVAAEGTILAAVYDGSNVFRSWSLDTFSLLCEKQIPNKSVHKDNSILTSDNFSGENVLHAFRSGSFATVQSARSGQILKILQCFDKTSSIVALATTKEYFIVCCRQRSITHHEIHALELFDVSKGVYVRSVQGCGLDNIKYLTTNLIGSHAICISPNYRTMTSDVAIFNLETEEHKHLAYHTGVSTMCACLDFRFCVTGAAGDSFLKIWNLSQTVNQKAPKQKKQFGLSDIWPMIDNPRYVLAKAINNGPISIWNVTKGKCLQSAVRIERGLTEGTDAIVVRNARLVILTDKGLSAVSEEPTLVFKTVLVYDLKVKKYIRKLAGCYIVPAASHEYTLLDNDSLLGPSDTRSHFIIWNLITGQVAFRIKANFKELDSVKTDLDVQTVNVPRIKRETSVNELPWKKRTKSKSAHRSRQYNQTEAEMKRLEEYKKERNNVVDQFLVSENQKVIVASFYAHHMCVFDVQQHKHIQTLQTDYSMLFLFSSALTFDGSHLVHANYDEVHKVCYVTLWNCTTGEIKRRLKNETDVTSLAITDDAGRVVIGQSPNNLHIWDPMKSRSLRRLGGYERLQIQNNTKIILVEHGQKAIIFSGDISVWDLTRRTVLTIFTPDSQISVCKVVFDGKLILLGMYDKPELIVLKLTSSGMMQVEETAGEELFGETTGDTPNEDSDEEESDVNN